MHNQKGEVMIGVMAVMMVGMMLFGGMHLFRGKHRSEGGHSKVEQKTGHDNENHGEQMQHCR